MKQLRERITLDRNKNIETQFSEIAQNLFQNYHIEKQIKRKEKEEIIRYDFLEIEFYYYMTGHVDSVTYKRTCPAGVWYPHYSGVDIAFESDEAQGYYGGILIRSLVKGKEVIAGPLRCSCELFANLLDIYGHSNSLQLVLNQNEEEKVKIEWTKRFGVSTNEQYCAYIRKRKGCDPNWKNDSKSYNAKPWERK